MLRFYAHLYTVAMRSLSNATAYLSMARLVGSGDKEALNFKDQINRALGELNNPLIANGLPLSPLLRVKIERLTKRMQTMGSRLTITQAESLLKELHNDLVIDLANSLFLTIPFDQAEFYVQSQPLFGQEVGDAFPDADADIAAAGRCLALEEWTAAVFHLMRASEVALRLLARRLRIRKTEIKEWATLLQDIDRVLIQLRQRRRTSKRDRNLQYYSQARSSFAAFKDAWRNHVMHSRVEYDKKEAMKIYEHVKALMQQLVVNS